MFALLLETLLLIAGASVVIHVIRDGVKRSRERGPRRAAYLDPCKAVFAGGIKAISTDGFPRISGTYRGKTYDVQVVPDTLNFRKLPALWLLVSVIEKQPVASTLDIMLRPRGVEAFSNFNSLPQQITIPPGFPEDCAVRTDEAGTLPDLAVIRRHRHLIDAPQAKELIVSPKGLRSVWLAEEARRGPYLLFREAELGLEPLEPDRLKKIMDDLAALHDDLAAHYSASA